MLNTSHNTDVAIIGAGPYGLSIAAHLRKKKLKFRIFGTPMQSWSENMPKGMQLKSDGFASSLYDPDSNYTLRHYCQEHDLPYRDVGLPVPLDTFVSYGREFQKRMVPSLDPTNVTSVERTAKGFQLTTADGQSVHTRRLVLAIGITHFPYLPPDLAQLPAPLVSHSFQPRNLSDLKDQKVLIVGAGASAVDLAALVNEAGAQTQLVARTKEIAFHSPSKEPRPLHQQILNPRSGLGLGWRSRLCTDAPLLFYRMPQKLRFRAVENHLGPAPGWFVRDKVVGRFPLHLGAAIQSVQAKDNQVRLNISTESGETRELVADHLIAATGFRPSVSRLTFLEDALIRQIRTVEDTPALSPTFESSIPGLFMVGLASSNCFGPLTRFAYGAKFTARHLSGHLAAIN